MAVRASETTERLRDAGYEGLDDRMLVLDFQAGHEGAAYDEIYRRYAGLARHVAFRILADRDAADEIVQETMLRVYQGLSRFNGRYLLQPWVARIATNVSLDVLRQRQRRPQLSDRSLNELVDEIGWDDQDLDEQIDRILQRDEVRAVLAGLPDHHREALVQREFDGRSHEEIAASLGMTPPQAKALIHRAKGSFRRAWEGEERRSGVAAWLPWFLLPNLFRKLQGATEAAATRVGTSPVVQSIAPVASEQTVSTADKITTAIVVVALASTVGAGTVAVKKARDRGEREAVAAAVAPSSPDASVPTLVPTADEPKAAKEKAAREKAAKEDGKGEKGSDEPKEAEVEVVPAAEESASPTPTPSPTPSPSATESTTPPTPPPAPAWSGTFDSPPQLGRSSLRLTSSMVDGRFQDEIVFSQAAAGRLVAEDGSKGKVSIEYWGSVGGDGTGSISMWLFIDTAVGQFRYDAAAALTSTVVAENGAVTSTFQAPYVLSARPEDIGDMEVPHDGTVTFTLGFWPDGTLYRTAVALDESGA